MKEDGEQQQGPYRAFEALLSQLGERARQAQLIQINNDLTDDLDLPTVLRRIVEVGTELVQAGYGAISIIRPDGLSHERFVHVRPDGPVYTDRDARPDAPAHLAWHGPPMSTFLEVPIRLRQEIFGSLHLADSRVGRFTAADESLAEALAATVAIAIENARLFEDSAYRARWTAALSEVSGRPSVTDDGQEVDLLLQRAVELADATFATVALVSPDGEHVLIHRATGPGTDVFVGRTFPVSATTVEALAQERALLVDALPTFPEAAEEPGVLGPAILVPFTAGCKRCLFTLGRQHDDALPFAPRDVDMALSFAEQLGVEIERSDARDTRRRQELLEDRSRIARDLHDLVIQQLFAIGLNLQAIAATTDDTAADVITSQVRGLDETIAQIRQSIFAIRRAPGATAFLRARVLEVTDRLDASLKPRVTFVGPVDLMADADLTDDVVAVVTEAVTNVAKHAAASTVVLSVSAAAGRMTVRVDDDGRGLHDGARSSGLANLRARAEERRGSFEVTGTPGEGTHLVWSVPLP